MDHDSRSTAGVRPEGDAILNARHRLALLAETVGTRHPEYATGLNQLALLLIMQGDPLSAEPYLREALEVRRDSLGEAHPDYATNLSSLGGLLWARGALDEAEPLLRRAAEVRVATLGSSHPKTVVSLNSLEQLIEAQRSLATAPPEEETDAVAGHQAEASPLSVPLRPTLSAAATAARVAPGTPITPPPPPTRVVTAVDSGPTEPDEEVTLAAAETSLGTLAEEFSRLGDRFLEAARALLDRGRLPSSDLIQEARASRGRFEALRATIREMAAVVELTGFEPGSDVATLAANAATLHESVRNRTRWVEERKAAVARLRLVEGLACPTDPAFAPLAACRTAASELRRSIGGHDLGSQPGEVEELLRGEHRLAALLELATADAALDDERWAHLFERVEAEFGSSLAVAVARGRIRPPAF